MTTTSRAGWLALAFFCVANWLSAQTSIQDELLRADKQFDLYAYNLALKTYKQVLDKDANNGQALAGIADCYFQLNKPEESLSWYARAVEQRRSDSDVQLRYGKALMLKGDYAQARRQFLEYAAQSSQTLETGRHYANMCDYATNNAAKAANFTVRNEPLNTSASDFSPVFLGARVVYSSARTDIVRKTETKTASDWSGSAYNQLFVTQRNPENGYLQKPAFLRGDLQNNYNEGPVSYSADGKRVAFCRNNFINGTRQIAEKGVNMSLYIADVADGEWTNIKAFPYNGSEFATGFPCLSASGNTLIFASNNPNSTTGGKGWDIYVSNLVNGEWSAPRNLGAPLNTPGNEVTPYYDGADLYFSSDWHSGLGGLDVFRAEVGKDAISNIYHLGPGVNSSYDDYGFVFSSQQNMGYLTSNRPGGRGNEDIWQVMKKGDNIAYSPVSTTPPSSLSASPGTALAPQIYSTDDGALRTYFLLVTDTWGKPLQGVDVDLSECNREKGQTDFEGKYYFSALSRPVNCTIGLSKAGYESAMLDVREFGGRSISASINLDKRREFTGKILDASTNQPIYGAIIEFTDNGKTIQTSTDALGQYVLTLVPLNTYDVEYSHDGYKVVRLKVRPGVSGDGNFLSTVLLQPGYDLIASGTTSTLRSVTPAGSQTGPLFYDQTPTTYSTITSRPITTLIPAQQPEPEAEFSGYSVQLSATPETLTESSAKKYETLSKHGNLYVKDEGNVNKVRLGVFPTKAEAQKALKEVNKDSRFKGAFIVEERGADKNLIIGEQAGAAPVTYSTTSRSAVPNTDIRYAVQLGSFSPDNPIAISDYASLSGVGNVYSKTISNSIKVRLGVWANYADAENARAEAVKRGFADALIVTELASDESLKGFMITAKGGSAPATYSTSTPSRSKWESKSVEPTTYSQDAGTRYYIRLCALADPNRFDADKLEGAGVDGTIEKWPVRNTGLTAIMLGGYTTEAAAKKDKEKLRDTGFPEAYVVREQNGEVTRIK